MHQVDGYGNQDQIQNILDGANRPSTIEWNCGNLWPDHDGDWNSDACNVSKPVLCDARTYNELYFITDNPTTQPTSYPTADPTVDPTIDSSADPSSDPTEDPTKDPTMIPIYQNIAQQQFLY